MKLATRAVLVTVVAAAVAALLAVGLTAVAVSEDSADLVYDSLDYDVDVQPNGNLVVSQTVGIQLSDREDEDGDPRPWKQLYQRYMLNSANLTDITDVTVTDLDTGQEYERGTSTLPNSVDDEEWDTQYAGHWYLGTVEPNGDEPVPGVKALASTLPGAFGQDDATGDDAPSRQLVELGWDIPAIESGHRRFRIDMTLTGVATVYDDVAGFQWEPVGTTNQVPVRTLNATLRFPEALRTDDSWTWLHFEGDGSVTRVDGTLKVTARNVHAGDYFDLVAMVDRAILPDVARRAHGDARQRVLDDEAAQELAWAEGERRAARVRLGVWIAIAAVGLVLGALAIALAVRNLRAGRYRGDLDYWREEPELSPGAAAILYDVAARRVGDSSNRQFAATLMSLETKGAVLIRPGRRKLYLGLDLNTVTAEELRQANADLDDAEFAKALGDGATLMVMPRARAEHHEELGLCESEERLLDLLLDAVARLHTPTFSLEQMANAFAAASSGARAVKRFKDACDDELDGAVQSLGAAPVVCGILEMMFGVVAIFCFAFGARNLWLSFAVGVPIVALGALAWAMTTTRGVADGEEAQERAGQVLGLAHYMEDYSRFEDRGVLDTVLWGRYLVYATAFGIGDKVLAQLRAAYPQVADGDWLDSDVLFSSGLLYWSLTPGSQVGGTISGMGGDGFGSLGSQLSGGFATVQATVTAASSTTGVSTSGGFGGSSFGGSFGGSGGGSFGGR